jgi:hypothetical protein
VAAEPLPPPPPEPAPVAPPPPEPAPVAPAAPAGRDWALLVAVVVAVGSGMILFRSLLPAKRALAANLRHEQELLERRASLKEEERRLRVQEKALQEDPLYMERLLRRQTDMSREDELLVR